MKDSEIKKHCHHEGSISMVKEKATAEERMEAARACAEGRLSVSEAARRLGVDRTTVRSWVFRYKAQSAEAFRKQEHNNVYSSEL